MDNLIPIKYENDRLTVSARDLHEFLEVGTRYTDWFPRMCEYGFTEGQDFNLLKNERVQLEGNRAVTRIIDDAQLTIDMAKEICMIQRNEKGKQARRYFIQLEKDWNSPEKVMARALKIAESKITALESKVQQDAPKVLFADAVATSHTSILIGELAKILKQNGLDIGQNRLFAALRNGGFLISRKGSDYNMPTQRSMNAGLMEIKETTVANPDGSVRITRTPKVTGKGQIYFTRRFLETA